MEKWCSAKPGDIEPQFVGQANLRRPPPAGWPPGSSLAWCLRHQVELGEFHTRAFSLSPGGVQVRCRGIPPAAIGG